MIKNKRGIEMNISTIIMIILAILVLVLLTIWFTGGFGWFAGRMKGIAGLYTKTTLDDAKTYCSGLTIQEFCQVKQKLWNDKNQTYDGFYCFEYPISAKLSYTDPTTGEKITVSSASKCDEMGYSPPE